MSNTLTRDPQARAQHSCEGSRIASGLPAPVVASVDLLVGLDDAPATGFAVGGGKGRTATLPRSAHSDGGNRPVGPPLSLADDLIGAVA
jgi:hypothetical protein